MVSLPVVNGSSNTWGTLLNTYLLVAHNSNGTLKDSYKWTDFPGVDPTGVSDSTSGIQACINAASSGGIAWGPPGTYLISSQLALSNPGTYLDGMGMKTVLQMSGSFSGSSPVSITADWCGVRNMRIVGGPNTSSASNPSVTSGVEISSARLPTVENVAFYYVNGYIIESVSGASINNVGGQYNNNRVVHCAQGMHLQGVAGSSYVGQNFITNYHPENIDNGDALVLEDINDTKIANMDGALAGGSVSGSMLHIKGHCSGVYIVNPDLGATTLSTVSPIVLIEASSGNSPTDITIIGGVFQAGNNALKITDASNAKFIGTKFKGSNGHGVSLTGSGTVRFIGCDWATNNQSGGTNYDIDATGFTGNFYVLDYLFQTPIASSTSGSVPSVANDPNHKGYFLTGHFAGSGGAPSTVFASGGTSQIVRGIGYNPRGSVTPPTITFGSTLNTSQNDVNIIFTAINGMTSFSINSTSVGLPTVGVPYHVMARTNIVVNGSGTIPTWTWIAD